MTNKELAAQFNLLAKLMEIHGENSFKSKSYASAAFAIEKLPLALSELPAEKIADIKGIGASAAGKIIALLNTGSLEILETLIEKTPAGIFEIMQIRGIGAKKINSIWKEMEIESMGELLYACNENRLKLYKGFGEKTQEQVKASIEFFIQNKGSYLYASVALLAEEIKGILCRLVGENDVAVTGDVARQLPVINAIAFVVKADAENLIKKLTETTEFIIDKTDENTLQLTLPNTPKIIVHIANNNNWISKQIETSASAAFMAALPLSTNELNAKTTDEYFLQRGLHFIPAFARETESVIAKASKETLPSVITTQDIKGLIHCHSNWSDGANTLEEMANAAANGGLAYMLITDHSKSAFYANGLKEERIQAQQEAIDALNLRLAPFKIFKGIESDILNTGELDYSTAVLNSFDVVIASVHSNLKMTEDKAMERLIKAIENKYTSILGHSTGRLLLSRAGYPVNHKKIIDACAANNVALELNANPNRLDVGWEYIDYALNKGVLISINPDAHSIAGISHCTYGVLVAQKALVTAAHNVSSFTLPAFEQFVESQKKKRN